ncbi:hypothetical protein ACV1EC_03460 [Aeromonas hydrophila]
MLDLYQGISVFGDKNSWRQWVVVMIVSQKYRSGPVLNLGRVLLNSIFMASVGDGAPLLRCLFFRQAPIARIFIFIEAGISNG